MYECLVEDYKSEGVDFASVKSVNLDGYYHITPDNEQSYRYFMNHHLFDKVNINKVDTYVRYVTLICDKDAGNSI